MTNDEPNEPDLDNEPDLESSTSADTAAPDSGSGDQPVVELSKLVTQGPSAGSLQRIIGAGVGVAAAIVTLIVVGLGVLWALGFSGFARSWWTTFRLVAPLVYSLLGVAVLVGLMLFGSSLLRRLAVGVAVVSILGGIASAVGIASSVGVGNVWSALNRAGHEERVDYIGQTVAVGEQRPGFDERIALAQANFSIRRSLSGVVGDIADPIRVNDEWCSYVTTAATSRNRWTESVVCLADNGDIRQASFASDTVPAVTGGFRHSKLSNVVSSEAGINAVYDSDDVYGYIDDAGADGQPVARLVVPLSDYRGFDYSISRMPAGALVFGGSEIELLRDIAPGTHPGPVAGLSTAERIRESVNDLEGFLISKRPTRSSQSLQPTFALGADETEEGDPNAANATEFVLYRDGIPYAVTPLTSFGASSTITAYLEVRLDTVTAGEPLEAVIYRLPEGEAANTTLTNSVRVLYGQDLSEADEIYEVTPTVPGRSRMTIGREDQTRFIGRSETRIANGEPIGEICMSSRTGGELDCSQLSDDPKPLGTLVRSSASGVTGAGAGSSGVVFEGDLSEIPTRALLDELERRLGEG